MEYGGRLAASAIRLQSVAVVGDIDQQAIAFAVFAAPIQRNALACANAIGQINGEGALEMDLRVRRAVRFAVAGDGLMTSGEQVSRTLRKMAQFVGTNGTHAEHAGGVVLEDHFAVHGGEHGIDVDAVVGVDIAIDESAHGVLLENGSEHTGLARRRAGTGVRA